MINFSMFDVVLLFSLLVFLCIMEIMGKIHQ